MNPYSKGLIICGTDTDIGKTVISTLFVQGLNAIYWKPIQSGSELCSDTEYVCQLLNLERSRYLSEIYKFRAPVSPHWAAEKEGEYVKTEQLKLPLVTSPLIIETAGGLMVPLNRQELQIDQIKKWKLPVVLVVKSSLGTLNHTLLSLEALKKRSIPIRGIIINGPIHEDNPKTIEEFGNIPVLAQIPYIQNITADSLHEEWEKQSLGSSFIDLIRNVK